MKDLTQQVGVAVACLVAMNLAVVHLARNSNVRVYARSIRLAPHCTDLFVGHSMVAGGVDTETFDATVPGLRALNIGMNSTGPVEHVLLLKQASGQSPACLYYGFVNDQLTHRPETDPTSDLIGHRAMVYDRDAFDTEAGSRFYAGKDRFRYWSMQTIARVPMLREQSTMWQKVEQGRRWLGALGLTRSRVNRFGRVDDMRNLIADPREFEVTLRTAIESQAPLSGPIHALFEWASLRKATFYLILMPVTKAHRDRYYATPQWSVYRDQIARLIAAAGGVFIEAQDWIGDDGFEDAIHLSRAGARAFSARLARRVIDRS